MSACFGKKIHFWYCKNSCKECRGRGVTFHIINISPYSPYFMNFKEECRPCLFAIPLDENYEVL
jgi:predicted metal-binding transcription factor (methanogenesis marker protein 9)